MRGSRSVHHLTHRRAGSRRFRRQPSSGCHAALARPLPCVQTRPLAGSRTESVSSLGGGLELRGQAEEGLAAQE
ncbi:hypothetical protein FQA47_012275 [Oryzias melastigma]|uniref:Uncharacterized protein n=1 Tax=Oryzias melastigma TaxID=30732 RepID=A0A834CIE6_ORYME|nr:hypothetical protein FQA47_012275 [Oryzias melastigma]